MSEEFKNLESKAVEGVPTGEILHFEQQDKSEDLRSAVGNVAVQKGQQPSAEIASVENVEPSVNGERGRERTKKLKENFGFVGPITFLYACIKLMQE